MNIIIINSGVSHRTKSFGPVCLFSITPRKTLIERQIDIFNSLMPRAKIDTIVGFKSKRIRKHLENININILENPDFEYTNDLYSLGLLLDNIKDKLLIVPGNIVFKKNLFRDFDKKKSQIWINKYQVSELGCTITNNKIENIMWSLTNYLSGLYFLTGAELDSFKEICKDPKTHKWFIFEGINHIIKNGGKIMPNYTKSITYHINNILELNNVKI